MTDTDKGAEESMIVIAGDHVSLPAGNLLGNKGDDMIYDHKIIHPKIEGARFFFGLQRTNELVIFEIEADGTFHTPAVMMAESGEFTAQVWAEKSISDRVTRYWTSEKFTVRVGTVLHW